jgi:hypothetical protein
MSIAVGQLGSGTFLKAAWEETALWESNREEEIPRGKISERRRG